MGYLVYDSSTRVSFDDRVLAHLEVVIIAKLRRKESFAISWREPRAVGSGRSTLWFDSSIPLRFRFDGSRPPLIDREWVDRLAVAASSHGALVVADEDGEIVTGTTNEHGF